MRKIVSLLASGVVVMVLAACGTGTDFWGNPLPTPEPEGCTVAGPVPAPEPYDPESSARPAGVTPGNSWIVFGLEVRALGSDGYSDYCIPISVHVYTRSGEADTVSLNHAGFEPGPFDFATHTPWAGRLVALQYDPTEERFAGRPPAYEIHVDATYLFDRVKGEPVPEVTPVALRCAIQMRGATIVSDLAVVTEGTNTAVRCTFTSNDYWNHY